MNNKFRHEDRIFQFGGRSSTASTTQTTQDIQTRQVGFEGTEGIAVGGGGDVEFTLQTVDPGAIQGAVDIADSSFDFAGEFSGEGFDFARDIATQAGETSQQAVEVSRQAIATVGTGGQSEITQQFFKALPLVVAGIAAIFIIPRLVRSN